MGRHFSRSETAMGELVDGELVLLNMDSGEYFGLNPTGTRIWELLGEHGDLDRVHEALVRQYAVDPERLRADLEELVADLERAGLVHETTVR